MLWATATSQIVARVAGSTIGANSNLFGSISADFRPNSTNSSEKNGEETKILNKIKELRIRSPYALFVKENYASISSKNPSFKLAEISKTMSENWKSLNEEKKQIYVKKVEEQKAKYQEEKTRLNSENLRAVDAEEKARRIATKLKKAIEKMPLKRPRSAYSIFLSTLDRGEAEMKVFMSGANQRWTQMTIQEKQKFEEMHEEERRKYNEQLITWATENSTSTKRNSSVGKVKTEKKSNSAKPKKKSKTEDEISSSSDEEKGKTKGKKSSS